MKIFDQLFLPFTSPDWRNDPELCLINTIIEKHSDLLNLVKSDITKGCSKSNFGRKDTPSVDQILRAAIFKELKKLNYRELEYAQVDSKICEVFLKLNGRVPYSFQMWQKYISKIQASSLEKLLVQINQIAINEGLEDLEKVRTDSTTIETNIHYPTNNALIWDCIKEAHRLLSKLAINEKITITNFCKEAKKNYYNINLKKGDQRVELFIKQLQLFLRSIQQVDKFVKKKDYCDLLSIAILLSLKELLSLMRQIYDVAERKEVLGIPVANDEKIFSIYELHTDIIVKGSRDVVFGHKVNLTDSKSGLILDCKVVKGNPNDTTLFTPTLERIIDNYGHVPANIAADGGYASKENHKSAAQMGLTNIVFNKITGSLKNITENKAIEKALKKWRSGVEATVSNLKRGFKINRCYWKGWEHFQSKVLWSVICYNFRVLTKLVLQQA